MWEVEELPAFEQLQLADQVWLMALAVEENGGPREYVRALRGLAELLEELEWWLATGGAGSDPEVTPVGGR